MKVKIVIALCRTVQSGPILFLYHHNHHRQVYARVTPELRQDYFARLRQRYVRVIPGLRHGYVRVAPGLRPGYARVTPGLRQGCARATPAPEAERGGPAPGAEPRRGPRRGRGPGRAEAEPGDS